MFNSKTEQRINLKYLVKFKLWWKFTAKNACQELAFLNSTKDFVKARLTSQMIERLWRPTISKTANNIREIEKIVQEDRRLSIRLIAERMSIGKKTAWQVLHDNLHMTKVCTQVVSKLSTSDQKQKRQEVCADILKQIEENPKFLDSVITISAMRDEFSNTTQRQKGSSCIGKLQTHDKLWKQNKAKSKFKAMLIFFFYVEGVVVFFFYENPNETLCWC